MFEDFDISKFKKMKPPGNNSFETMQELKELKKILLNKRVRNIFKKFESSFNPNKNFIVAVSGGADSLALAFLTKLYATKNNMRPKYFIIDHKLRNESKDEALKVKKILL